MAKQASQSQLNHHPLLGYPIIEKLLDSEDFSKVNKTMLACYDTLERMLKNKTGGLKKQQMIRQALKSYDLTIDLIKELLKIKYQLLAKNPSSGTEAKREKK